MKKRDKSKQTNDPFFKPYTQTFKGKSDNQVDYIRAVNNNTVICAHGPAGCGKTHIAIGTAVRHFKNEGSLIDNIVLARPAIEGGGERLGFQPGNMYEKISGYMRPLYEELNYFLSHSAIGQLSREKFIRVEPLAFIRGLTLKNSFVIVDEAQNASYEQLKMVWTRLGENSKLVIAGDIEQSDLLKHEQGGFWKLMDIMDGLEDFTSVKLETIDICRHEMVKKMLNREQERRTEESAPIPRYF